MNNMYDILGKMNLLEGRGSKPDFLDLDRDGDKKEPMKAAAKQAKKLDELSPELLNRAGQKADANRDAARKALVNRGEWRSTDLPDENLIDKALAKRVDKFYTAADAAKKRIANRTVAQTMSPAMARKLAVDPTTARQLGMAEADGQGQQPFPFDSNKIVQLLSKRLPAEHEPGWAYDPMRQTRGSVRIALLHAFNEGPEEGLRVYRNASYGRMDPGYTKYIGKRAMVIDAFEETNDFLKRNGIDIRSWDRKQGGLPAESAMAEADVEEGNRFTGNLMKARAAGKKMADLDGDGDMEPVREYEFDDRDDFDRRARPGDTVKTTKGTLKKTDRGVQHTRRYDDDNKGSDDDYDEHGNLKPGRKDASAEKRGRGRPKGTKHAIGAKGPSGKSKLLKKGAIREDGIDDEGISLVDKGEYDREGDMAKEQLHTMKLAAMELSSILGDDENLPEWVQSKITKALDYIDTARDYMISTKADMEPVAEKAVSKNQAVAARIARGVQKGEIKSEPGTASAEMARMRPKELKKFAKTDTKGLPKKVKAETAEESTVAGSVATSPATGKGKKGMIFGKGVYESQITESYNRRLSEVLTEGISINLSMGENGERNLSVQASDEDAVKLAQILKLAGMGQSDGYQHMEEDLANAPEAETQTADYMTKTIAGGLNKQKRDIAGDGQTTVPVTAVRVQEAEELESHLSKLYQQYKA